MEFKKLYNTRLGKKLVTLIPENKDFVDYEVNQVSIFDDPEFYSGTKFAHYDYIVEYRGMMFGVIQFRNGDTDFSLIR